MSNGAIRWCNVVCLLFKHILFSYKCTIRLETSYINLVYPLYAIMLYTKIRKWQQVTQYNKCIHEYIS